MNKNLIMALVGATLITTPALARDYISIVGSSTVYPFTTVVAENLGQLTNLKTPVVESTGTGGGFKLFCSGVGVDTADVSNASRAIKDSEVADCEKNGVTAITEVKIGYDGIVVAQSNAAESITLSRRDIFLALAKDIPDGNGGLKSNDNVTWQDVREDLPAIKIEVLGPPPTSGTRDAFVELVMEEGAKTFDELAAIKKEDGKKFTAIAHAIREDGAFVEAGENDVLIVRKIEANTNSFGVFGFSFLDQNTDKIKGVAIEDVTPTYETIADGSYSVSRPLFFYVKDAHIGVIPGLNEFVELFVKLSEEDGLLAEKGLIPLPESERDMMVRPVQK